MGTSNDNNNRIDQELTIAQQRFCSVAEGTFIVSDKKKHEEAIKKLKEMLKKNNFKKI